MKWRGGWDWGFKSLRGKYIYTLRSLHIVFLKISSVFKTFQTLWSNRLYVIVFKWTLVVFKWLLFFPVERIFLNLVFSALSLQNALLNLHLMKISAFMCLCFLWIFVNASRRALTLSSYWNFTFWNLLCLLLGSVFGTKESLAQ